MRRVCEAGVSRMRTYRISANGLEFAVDEAGEGDRVALLLHGFPECRATWVAQLPALARLGWRVVAPDLRGYGDTSRPQDRAAYRLDRLTDDVKALFEVLVARQRVLVGHDWGGMIAWDAAIRGDVGLDGLVILNAPHPAVFQRVARSFEQKRRSWYVLFFLLPLLPERHLTADGGRRLVGILKQASGSFSEDLLARIGRNIQQPGAARAMLAYYRENALAIASRPPGEPDPLRTPTLMIWGDADTALSPRLTEGNEAYVADFTLRRLHGVSHWVQHEAPDRVNDLIAEWAKAKGLADIQRDGA